MDLLLDLLCLTAGADLVELLCDVLGDDDVALNLFRKDVADALIEALDPVGGAAHKRHSR